MKRIILFLSIFIISGFLVGGVSLAQKNSIEIHFFYNVFCPHCQKEKEFLKELKEQYPEVNIKEYEVTYHPENQEILKEFYERYQVPKKERGLVPITFTANRYFIGFNEQIGKEIENCIKECLGERPKVSQKIKIPLFGKIDLSQMSLLALTITLGALDGLNPCAMWILLFLIAILINARSKKRMFLIGGTFILASGVIYFLLLSAWLNLFLAISYVNLTRILVGAFALGVGIWQIKNFISYRPGVCPVIEKKGRILDKIKEKFKDHAKKVALAPLTFSILIGVIVLAIGINLVEFFCSAGLPAIFTRILALHPLSTLSYYFYLLLYTFIFMLDDLIIFSLAVITLSKIGFTEKYNYWATLIGGVLILILGILLIFRPGFLVFI